MGGTVPPFFNSGASVTILLPHFTTVNRTALGLPDKNEPPLAFPLSRIRQ